MTNVSQKFYFESLTPIHLNVNVVALLLDVKKLLANTFFDVPIVHVFQEAIKKKRKQLDV